MSSLVVEGSLQDGLPPLFHVKLVVQSDFDQAALDASRSFPEDYRVIGLGDTGSRQCLIIPGLLSERHFVQRPLSCPMVAPRGRAFECRGQRMALAFSAGRAVKSFDVPVFEMRFGPTLPPGSMLIGRTLLGQAVLTYDGPSRRVTLTFPDDRPVKV